MMTPCAVCGSLTFDPSLVALRYPDGESAPFAACRLCRMTLMRGARPGMRLVRLVNPDGSPLSTPRGALDRTAELPAGGRMVPAVGHPPS